jgi:hypothetical protein
MKWLIACILALGLAIPAISHAQTEELEQQNPNQYRDTEDGQTLKGVSYILTPVGMLLEWGVARPLHYLATKTFMGPVLSGDKKSIFFTENDNADQLPPGTFAPYRINPSNNMVPSTEAAPPAASAAKTSEASQSTAQSKPLLPSTQPALH